MGDTMQEGYWSRRRTAPEQNQQVLGEMKLPSKVGDKFVRRRRKPPPPPPPVVIPKPLPYVPSRRRYVDRRRRFPSPKKISEEGDNRPGPEPNCTKETNRGENSRERVCSCNEQRVGEHQIEPQHRRGDAINR